MVGISLPSSGASGTPFRGAADVAFRPKEFTSTITNDFATVPWCTNDFGDYSSTATDHLSRVNNPAAGLGDICRYMGTVDGATWRMPTAAEIAELYGSDQIDGGQAVKLGNGWIEGNYYPLSGRAMGAHQTNVAITGSGTDAQITGADPNTDGALFLPASGHRTYTNGAIYSIGLQGWYWSSTASAIDNGYNMQFNSTSVWPQNSAIRRYAWSIRCIRE